MRLRNPLIALAVLAGLAGYVYLVELKGGEKKQKEKEVSEKVFPLEPKEVSEITLVRGVEPVRLRKQEGAWKIVEPLMADPEPDAVDRLARSLTEIRITRDLGQLPDVSPYNLADPPLKVVVRSTASKPPQTFVLGDPAPTGGGEYARLGEKGKVVVVSGADSLKSSTLFTLRDKTLLRFDPERLASLRIARGKDQATLSKVGGKWRLTAPVLAPADESSISDLLFALERLSVQEFVEQKPSPSSLKGRGLDPPRARVLLAGDEWQGDRELAFGTVADGSVFALRPGTGELVRVTDAAEAKLKDAVASLRKKDLLPYPRYEIARLRVTGVVPGPLALERKSDTQWRMTSPSKGLLAEEGVDLLLRTFTDLKTDRFIDAAAGAPARYGLAKPAVKLEFWKQDQKQGEASVVEIGSSSGKGKVAMRDPAWPSVMMVDAAVWKRVLDQIVKVAGEKVTPEPSTSQTRTSPSPTKPAPGSPSS